MFKGFVTISYAIYCKDTKKYLTRCIFYRIIFISSIKNIKKIPILQYLLYLCKVFLISSHEG